MTLGGRRGGSATSYSPRCSPPCLDSRYDDKDSRHDRRPKRHFLSLVLCLNEAFSMTEQQLIIQTTQTPGNSVINVFLYSAMKTWINIQQPQVGSEVNLQMNETISIKLTEHYLRVASLAFRSHCLEIFTSISSPRRPDSNWVPPSCIKPIV